MIVDCFSFFNELDLLELRLNVLNPVVDRFVIVEASRTFQNEPKRLYFEENRARYEKFMHKIVHVKVESFPKFNFRKFRRPTAWDTENHQKNMIRMGLKDCSPDDVIIVSDLDEIPKADLVLKFAKVPGIKVFHQSLSYYYLNCVAVKCPNEANLYLRNGVVYWKGTVMLDYKYFKSFKQCRRLQNLPDEEVVPVVEGGWHFSLMGRLDDILYKLRSWAHAKEKHYSIDHLNDKDNLRKIIDSGDDLFGRDFKFKVFALNHCFPSYVVEHPAMFDQMVCKGGADSIC